MSDELKIGIALLAAIVVGVFTFKARFVEGKTRKQMFLEKAKADGYYTEGKPVKTRFVHRDRDNTSFCDYEIVKYQYTVNGKKYHKRMKFEVHGFSGDAPYKVTVYYDPRNPRKAVCPEEATEAARYQSGCLTTIGTVILTIFCVFYILRFFFG